MNMNYHGKRGFFWGSSNKEESVNIKADATEQMSDGKNFKSNSTELKLDNIGKEQVNDEGTLFESVIEQIKPDQITQPIVN